MCFVTVSKMKDANNFMEEIYSMWSAKMNLKGEILCMKNLKIVSQTDKYENMGWIGERGDKLDTNVHACIKQSHTHNLTENECLCNLVRM
jgi:hypothetical protein